jgi:hypothetical protein
MVGDHDEAAPLQAIVHCLGSGHDAELLGYVADAAHSSADPLPLYRMAEVCRGCGDIAAWRHCIELAFQRCHATHEQRYERGRAKLTLGDWSGWADYESRQFKLSSHQSDYSRQLRWSRRTWDGVEDIRDKSLLVVHEQGYGDTIQMLRFVPYLTAASSRLILVVQPELLDFVSHNVDGAVQVCCRERNIPPPSDRHVRVMSLPFLCGELPSFVPLKATIASTKPQQPLPLQVGICWSGSSSYPKDAQRSISLNALEPLCRVADIQFHSLQVGPRASDLHEWTNLEPLHSPVTSFADTANFISERLDCVVTVDTAVAHLAGNLGIPTFVLLAAAASWRWELGDQTPWYPSIRLFRQQRQGEWKDVVEKISACLSLLAAAHRQARIAPP